MIRHPVFSGPPTLGKMAKGGEWETAKVFTPGEFTAEPVVSGYIGESTEVACEAFFGNAFFGSRREGTPRELAGFVMGFNNALSAAESGFDFFAVVSEQLGIPVARHFRFAEVGAVDAWKSVGPFRVNDPVCELEAFESLCSRLESSRVAEDTVHRKALEFAFDNGDGTTHWVALPVSEGSRLSVPMLKDALEFFGAWSQTTS